MRVLLRLVQTTVVLSFTIVLVWVVYFAFVADLFVLWAVPWSAVREIRNGTEKQDVLLKLGKPIRQGGERIWYYRVRGAGDLYHITFDDDDRVTRHGF